MNFIEILTYIFFFLLIKSIIQRLSQIEASLIIFIIIISTYGESLNLFVYKATSYTGRTGVPIYIILGGCLIGWANYRIPCLIAEKLDKKGLFSKICLFFLVSLLFPVIEILGIKAGCWHWVKPYSITSPVWWLGVWKFYFLFLGIPALAALVKSHYKSPNK